MNPIPLTCPKCGADAAHPTSEKDSIRLYECGTVSANTGNVMLGRLCIITNRQNTLTQEVVKPISDRLTALTDRVDRLEQAVGPPEIRHDEVEQDHPCSGTLKFANGRFECDECQRRFEIKRV